MYSKAQLNSFAKLDTSRVVNTPRSVLACELEGIDPTELIARGSQSPRRRYPVGSKEDQKQRLEEEFEEREYQKLLAVAKKRWSQLSSSRIGSAKSTAHVSTTKTTPRGDNTAISSESKRWVAGIDKEVASAAAQVIEADVTVAKRFLQLKNNVEDAAKARADLEERELAAQERYDALMASRKLHAIEQGKKFEARQLKVVSSQSSQLEDRKQRLEARLATLQERLEAADRNVAEMKVTRSKGAVKKGGEEERLAVEIAQREKAEALERKLSAAHHTAMERRAMKAVADELNQFQRDLKQRAMEKAQERAAKVQAYRQLQIREREMEDAEQDAQRSVERHREAKVRHAAREVIALQLEEVKRHVEMYTSVGNSDISTPDWLAPRLNQVQTTTPKKLPTRVPQPPPPKSETARQRELKQATREKFSISSPRVSERQVYANWMYE